MNKSKKTIFTIMLLSIFAIVLINVSCLLQQNEDQFSVGIEKMREGVVSESLYQGKEQVIHFDKKTGVHIYITENDRTNDGLFQVRGNIDFVVFESDSEGPWENMYVVLSNQFTLNYHEENGIRKIIDYYVQSKPGTKDVIISKQMFRSEIETEDILYLGKILKGTLYVNFSDTKWDIPAIYNWNCEMQFDENENFIFTLTAKQ